MKLKRTSDILLTVCFTVFLLALLLVMGYKGVMAVVFHQAATYSYYENRLFARPPELTVSAIMDGSFGEGLEDCLGDQAPGRETLLRVKTWMDLKLLRRPVVNDVVVCDDILLPFLPYATVDETAVAAAAQRTAETNRALQARIEDYGGVYCFAAVPCQYAYFEDEYPDYLNNRSELTEAALRELTKAMEAEGVNFVDMGAVFDALGHPTEFYSRIDNHYMLSGAYETYRAVIDAINRREGLALRLPVYGEDMDFLTLQNRYLGSRERKLFDLWGSDEHLQYAQFRQPIPFTRADFDTPREPLVYHAPASPGDSVPYGFYMDGDIGECRIDTGRDELPSGLIVGDSFTNAVECLAYYSFGELRSIDVRNYDAMTIAEYIEAFRPDVVICIRDYEALLDNWYNGAPFGAK